MAVAPRIFSWNTAKVGSFTAGVSEANLDFVTLRPSPGWVKSTRTCSGFQPAGLGVGGLVGTMTNSPTTVAQAYTSFATLGGVSILRFVSPFSGFGSRTWLSSTTCLFSIRSAMRKRSMALARAR